MDINDTSHVIKVLNECARGAREPETWRVETFTMHRESPRHGYQDVVVKILDRGPDFSPRYHVSAKTSDGKYCTGNPGEDLNETIRLVHWYQLDQ